MKLTQDLTFAAPPEQVAAMMRDPEFAKHVAIEVGATGFQTEPVPDGIKTTLVVPAPDKISGFIGPDVTVTDTAVFPGLTGTIALSLLGFPVTMDGPVTLNPSPDGNGCVATYEAEIRIAIPLIGSLVEKYAMKYTAKVVAICERVGNEWLAKQ